MHYVQKKALLAIISMIESGLREIRSVLTDASGPGEPDRIAVPVRQDPAYGSLLNDEEERSLEQIMEKNRQDMLRSAQSMFQESEGHT